jgi:hypothetical protein
LSPIRTIRVYTASNRSFGPASSSKTMRRAETIGIFSEIRSVSRGHRFRGGAFLYDEAPENLKIVERSPDFVQIALKRLECGQLYRISSFGFTNLKRVRSRCAKFSRDILNRLGEYSHVFLHVLDGIKGTDHLFGFFGEHSLPLSPAGCKVSLPPARTHYRTKPIVGCIVLVPALCSHRQSRRFHDMRLSDLLILIKVGQI